MAKRKVLKTFPFLQKAFQDPESDAEHRDQFEIAIDVVGFKILGDRPYKVEVKAAYQTLKSLFAIAWDRLSEDWKLDTVKELKPILTKIKFQSVEQIERSFSLISESGASGKPVSSLWSLLKEMESIHYSVYNAEISAKRGTPPDLLERGLGTCSCCFGQFHVRDDKMVRHGQRKVHEYMWSATCQGVNYPPLELSTAGLEEFIRRHEIWNAKTQAELAAPDKIEQVPRRTKNGQMMIGRDDPEFNQALGEYLTRLRRDAKDCEADLKTLQERLEHWSNKLARESIKGVGRGP